MASNAAVLVVCGLTLGVAVYVAANLPQGGDGGAGGDAGASSRLAELERRVAAMQSTLGETRDSVARIERRLARASGRAAEGGQGDGGGGRDLAGPGPDASVAATGPAAGDGADDSSAGGSDPRSDAAFAAAGDAVAERLERRIEAVAARERARGADGKWHAPIDELAQELGAEGETRAAVVRVLDGAKDQVCSILQTQRADGASLLDDYAKALRDTGDAPRATQAFFQRILAEKVPGTDETYFVAITRVTEATERDLGRHLGDAKMEKLRALRVDLLDVKTGHDPVGDAVRERLKQ